MSVKTSTLGTIHLSGNDAKKFTSQVTFKKTKKAAANGLIKGMQLLNEFDAKGYAVVKNKV